MESIPCLVVAIHSPQCVWGLLLGPDRIGVSNNIPPLLNGIRLRQNQCYDIITGNKSNIFYSFTKILFPRKSPHCHKYYLECELCYSLCMYYLVLDWIPRQLYISLTFAWKQWDWERTSSHSALHRSRMPALVSAEVAFAMNANNSKSSHNTQPHLKFWDRSPA